LEGALSRSRPFGVDMIVHPTKVFLNLLPSTITCSIIHPTCERYGTVEASSDSLLSLSTCLVHRLASDQKKKIHTQFPLSPPVVFVSRLLSTIAGSWSAHLCQSRAPPSLSPESLLCQRAQIFQFSVLLTLPSPTLTAFSPPSPLPTFLSLLPATTPAS
jgi:hypothetical protein